MASNNMLPPPKAGLRLGDGRAVADEQEAQIDNAAEDQKAVENPKGALTSKDKIAIIIMPIVIVILTAILGSGIGVWLQNRSFRRNELFKAKLERIMTAQKEAADILREVHEARRQIRSNEDFVQKVIRRQPNVVEQQKAKRYYIDNNPMEPSLTILRESKLRLDTLAAYSSSLSLKSPVPKAVNEYSRRLDAFLGCLKEYSYSQETCSDKYPDLLEFMRGVVVAHATMTDELIREYE